MNCPSCGAHNEDSARFCADCGSLLQSSASFDSENSQNGEGSANTSQSTPFHDQVQPTYVPQGQNYAKGCFGAAWDDVTSTDGWFGKTALLGLVNIVPILNWFVQGYAMRWARELSFDRVGPMPEKIFEGRNFINGAFQFVIALCVGIVSGLVGTFLFFIPVLGWIAAIVLSLALMMFQNVAVMRSALADSLGAGFALGDVWKVFKRDLSQLIGASYIAPIVVALIGLAATLICGLVFGAMEGVNVFVLIDGTGVYYNPLHALAVLGPIAGFVVVMYVVFAFLQAFSIVLTIRACGHYVARYAPEWPNNPEIAATAHIYDIR